MKFFTVVIATFLSLGSHFAMADNNIDADLNALQKRLMVIATKLQQQNAAQGGGADQKQRLEEERTEAVKANLSFDYSNDHVKGSVDAQYTIIEYADYSCPYCKQFHDTMKELVAQDSSISWVYRHFPIRGAMAPSSVLAYASECVYKHGSDSLFWDFNHQVYDSPTAMYKPEEFVKTFVESNNMDLHKIVSCQTESSTISKVTRSGQEAQSVKITGTPGVIIRNNKTQDVIVIPGAVDIPGIRRAIAMLSS